MKVHLVDGTYELFRHYFGAPPAQDADGNEIGAARGVIGSMVGMLEDGATHLGVATDHVVESFRNELYPGYKTGAGIEPDLLNQFHPLEDALEAMGVVVWRTIELEADDAMASVAAVAADDASVEKVIICTPDKDLSQCVIGDRVVQFDRRAKQMRNDQGVRDKFGVGPSSIPDYLALVGDSADGFPGLPGFGAKTAGKLLAKYEKLEGIPKDESDWEVQVRGAKGLAETLREKWGDALLFRDLATLRIDRSLLGAVDDLRWTGPRDSFAELAERFGMPRVLERVNRLAADRG